MPFIRRMTSRRNTRGVQHLGAAAIVTPDLISGLALWHRSDLGITLNGGNVSAWADQSGNGRNWTQGVAARQPLYNATDARMNNLPSLGFTNDYLTGADHTTLTAADGFVVLYHDADPPAADESLWHIGSNAGTPYQPFKADGNFYEHWGKSDSRPNIGNPANDLSVKHLYRVCSAPSLYTAEMNGTQLYTNGTNTVGWQTAVNITFGSNISAAIFFVGAIAEYIVYDHALSAGDLANLEAYIANRYGITVAA